MTSVLKNSIFQSKGTNAEYCVCVYLHLWPTAAERVILKAALLYVSAAVLTVCKHEGPTVGESVKEYGLCCSRS